MNNGNWSGMGWKKTPFIPFGDFWPLGLWQVFPESPESHNVSYGIKIMEFYHQTLRTMWSSPEKTEDWTLLNNGWKCVCLVKVYAKKKQVWRWNMVELMSQSGLIWDFQTTPGLVLHQKHGMFDSSTSRWQLRIVGCRIPSKSTFCGYSDLYLGTFVTKYTKSCFWTNVQPQINLLCLVCDGQTGEVGQFKPQVWVDWHCSHPQKGSASQRVCGTVSDSQDFWRLRWLPLIIWAGTRKSIRSTSHINYHDEPPNPRVDKAQKSRIFIWGCKIWNRSQSNIHGHHGLNLISSANGYKSGDSRTFWPKPM